jgi:hypothetical protein
LQLAVLLSQLLGKKRCSIRSNVVLATNEKTIRAAPLTCQGPKKLLILDTTLQTQYRTNIPERRRSR